MFVEALYVCLRGLILDFFSTHLFTKMIDQVVDIIDLIKHFIFVKILSFFKSVENLF